jgi:hypothetical protein
MSDPLTQCIDDFIEMREQRDMLLEALNEAADLLVDAGIPATKFLTLIAEIEASK